MEKTVTMSVKEYENLVKLHEEAQAKGQAILDAMAGTGKTLIIIDNPYKARTYTIYGSEPMAMILHLPLWRIIRMKLNRKALLAQAKLKEETI